MGRKLSFPSLFSANNPRSCNGECATPSSSCASSSSSGSSASSSWAWPSCKQPRTDSFRGAANVYKTVNSVYFDSAADSPLFSAAHSSSEESLSAAASDDVDDSEIVIRSVRRSSERLFFEPAGSSILIEKKKSSNKNHEMSGLLKESVVAMAMESEDPYRDFRESMEDMVAARGTASATADWEWLEELLTWYLRVNGKSNHGFIVGAFVDLLVGLAATAAAADDRDVDDAGRCSCSINSNSISSACFEIEEEISGSC